MADPRPTPPQRSGTSDARAARPSAWAKLAENPLPSILGAVIVVLLAFSLTVTNARISDTNDRMRSGRLTGTGLGMFTDALKLTVRAASFYSRALRGSGWCPLGSGFRRRAGHLRRVS